MNQWRNEYLRLARDGIFLEQFSDQRLITFVLSLESKRKLKHVFRRNETGSTVRGLVLVLRWSFPMDEEKMAPETLKRCIPHTCTS